LGRLGALSIKALKALRRLRARGEDAEAERLLELKGHLEQRMKALEHEAALLRSALKLLETHIEKTAPPILRVAESIRSLLPEEARAKVSVQETDSSFRIKIPYGVLSRQQFASVTRLVESMQGRWVSAGRDSHWEVPKQKQT
jgi:phage shock protein A